jgi:hypothetical protein
MHSNGCTLKYADTFAMTSPTSITELSSIVPTRSKINPHARKLVESRTIKKLPGRRDAGSVVVTCVYEKVQHAALEAFHVANPPTSKFWQQGFPDSGKHTARAYISEFGPPEVNEDNELETVFELTYDNADDDFTTS